MSLRKVFAAFGMCAVLALGSGVIVGCDDDDDVAEQIEDAVD